MLGLYVNGPVVESISTPELPVPDINARYLVLFVLSSLTFTDSAVFDVTVIEPPRLTLEPLIVT